MTIPELVELIAPAKWWLLDNGYEIRAGTYERAEMSLACGVWDKKTLLEFSRLVLPPGRRGRVRLCLNPPVEARAIAALAFLIRNVEPNNEENEGEV